MSSARMRPESPINRFFADLANRGSEPLVRKVAGTIRFDLADGTDKEHLLVSIDKGDTTVSRRNSRADAVVRAERAVFEDIISGRKNAMAAYLRGALQVEGNIELVVHFARLLPGPPRTEGSDDGAGRPKR
jgi:putative sterol carrier protein